MPVLRKCVEDVETYDAAAAQLVALCELILVLAPRRTSEMGCSVNNPLCHWHGVAEHRGRMTRPKTEAGIGKGQLVNVFSLSSGPNSALNIED